MTREELILKRFDVIKNFDIKGEVISLENYGSGHINDTFLALVNDEGKEKKYILQRINHNIFKEPDKLMENIAGVTSYLRKKIIENNGDPERETLNIVKTLDGGNYYKDELGSYWRVYKYIEDAKTYDKVLSAKDFYESAYAFGHFQNLLSDYKAETLHETIKSFHDTKKRFARFKEVLEADIKDRARNVQDEILFFIENEDLANILGDMVESGELPLRVTHNDTKLNNIMIDDESRRAICVIDLDTVMPGLAVNDFGDSIRFGANTAAEDEPDTSKVGLDLNLFETYAKGFIEGCNGSLTKRELDMLPTGAMVMTYECGMRFLTDYLEGDVYFKTSRKNHNLDRARTQMELLKDMKRNLDEMLDIIAKYR